jgi:multidrug resistance efflux pump
VPANFTRTLRALEYEARSRWLIPFAASALMLLAWSGWLFLGEIAVYAVSTTARFEVQAASFPVEAPVGGRVVATKLSLDRTVRANEVLLELEAEAERLSRAELEGQLTSLAAQVEALHEELLAGERVMRELPAQARLAVEEAHARTREAEATSRLAHSEASRAERLYATGSVTAAELERASERAHQAKAALEKLTLAGLRQQADNRTEHNRQAAQVARHKRELAALRGETARVQASLARVAHEEGQRFIRAPVAGRLASVAQLQIGSMLQAGERVASVVPDGAVRAVSELEPREALGRVRPGQRARMKLFGFPWGQYGSLSATVTNVAGEVRDGLVRVELSVHPPASPGPPLVHALPGTVEIEVERTSPAVLLLRASGRLVSSPTRAGPSQEGAPR